MKNNRLLRFFLTTALPLAVVLTLAVVSCLHFLPVTTISAQNVATEVVAGGLVGDDYAPERPLSTTLDKVDQIQPSSRDDLARQIQHKAADRQQTPRPEKKRNSGGQGSPGQQNESPVVQQGRDAIASPNDAIPQNAAITPQDDGFAQQHDDLVPPNEDLALPEDKGTGASDEDEDKTVAAPKGEGEGSVPASHDTIKISAPAPFSATDSRDPLKTQSDTLNNKIQLFGTVEFKRPLSSLPGWLNLLKRNAKDPIFIPEKFFKKNVTWDSFKEKAKGKSPMDLLRYVNSFWNTWPYKEDIVNWGTEDYWAIPAEFLKKSGDCEDYAIIKYFTLKELGIPPENMRIVVVRDTVRNLAHAVLAVYLNGDAYILDNLSNAVLSHSRIRQYSPQYSVNEMGRWAHLKGRKVNR